MPLEKFLLLYVTSSRSAEPNGKHGIIKKVTEPNEFCTRIVVVPKSTGAVQIYVYLKPLNASVLREPHLILTVDKALAQLLGPGLLCLKFYLLCF